LGSSLGRTTTTLLIALERSHLLNLVPPRELQGRVELGHAMFPNPLANAIGNGVKSKMSLSSDWPVLK
jgi:hypothetical protein